MNFGIMKYGFNMAYYGILLWDMMDYNMIMNFEIMNINGILMVNMVNINIHGILIWNISGIIS